MILTTVALPPPSLRVGAIPEITGEGYTAEQREQIQAGFEEVFELLKVYKSAGPDIVNPIFEKYFVPEDKAAVDSKWLGAHTTTGKRH